MPISGSSSEQIEIAYAFWTVEYFGDENIIVKVSRRVKIFVINFKFFFIGMILLVHRFQNNYTKKIKKFHDFSPYKNYKKV